MNEARRRVLMFKFSEVKKVFLPAGALALSCAFDFFLNVQSEF